MLETLYQEMAEQANQCEAWMVVLVVGVVAYVTYKRLWTGVLITSAGLFGWVFYTILTYHNLQQEKEAVGFLIMLILVGLVVNGTLLYKAVSDS